MSIHAYWGDSFASGSWVDGVWGSGSPAQVISSSAGGGKSRRRLRSFVELEGRLVEVSGYEEAERLVAELKQEEKAQEKDRKTLRIILGKVESKPDVGLYKRHEKIESIEKKMDDRADRIAQLYAMIQGNLEMSEDDEEVLLLS